MAKSSRREPAPEARLARREDMGFPPGVAYMDGRFCGISEAKISVLDWGFLRSDATYDVVHELWKWITQVGTGPGVSGRDWTPIELP